MTSLDDEMKADALEAQKFSRKHLVLELDFSESSIQELNNQCDSLDYALRGGKSPENLDKLVRIWGAYFGESLRRATGGEWVEESSAAGRRLGLRGESGHVTYPHEQIRGRLSDPKSDSLSAVFRAECARLRG
jgi:hypothetical protein